MIKYSKIIASFLFCFIIHGYVAQDFKADIIKSYKKFSNAAFQMDVKMKITHWDSSIPSTVSTGTIKRKGANYYSRFDGKINLKNSKYNVIITEQDKNILYFSFENSDKEVVPQNDLSMMNDTAKFKNVKLIKNDASGKEYEMINPQIGMTKMRISIANNGVLKQVKYYYEKIDDIPVKEVSITYSNVTFNPKFSSTTFSEKKYFQIINNKEVLASQYKNYTINNARR